MSIFFKLTPQTLNGIFTYIEESDAQVISIMAPNYHCAYYSNRNFEELWDKPQDFWENDMTRWVDCVLPEDFDLINADMHAQINRGEIPLNNFSYRIITGGGKIKYIKSSCFPLFDKDNCCVAIVAIFDEINADMFAVSRNHKNIHNVSFTYEHIESKVNDLTQIIESELKLSSKPTMQDLQLPYGGKVVRGRDKIILNDKIVTISKRELQCLWCFRVGMSAKEIGRKLNLSNRTIELYLENIKAKLGCQNKYQLMDYANAAQMFDLPERYK